MHIDGVQRAVINRDLSERPALFRQRIDELTAEVAALLSQSQRVEEPLRRGFYRFPSATRASKRRASIATGCADLRCGVATQVRVIILQVACGSIAVRPDAPHSSSDRTFLVLRTYRGQSWKR